MSLANQIDDMIKEAMKAKEAEKLTVLRLLKTAVKNLAIEKYGPNGTPTDEEVHQVIRKEVKKRIDSIESFEKAGRTEQANQEKREKAFLETFLPTQLSPEELDKLVTECVQETGASTKREMGAVMKLATEKAAGRADGKALSQAVLKVLS